MLLPGDPCPYFCGRTPAKPEFHFDTMGGRTLVLAFFVSAGFDLGRRFLAAVDAMAHRFDDRTASFFGVTVDPADEREGRLRDRPPGRRFFYDFDRRISARYGVCKPQGEGAVDAYTPLVYVIDPRLRVVGVLPMGDPEGCAAQLASLLDRLPPPEEPVPARPQAPVLVVPRVFEPDLCARLIALYDERGGERSGHMTERDGRTVGVLNAGMKVRRDRYVEDEALKDVLRQRLRRRLLPEIAKACQFRATHVERYLVACYDGTEGGHFRAHRDNTTKGTAHRQFAISVALNNGYEGGEVFFPEYGNALFRAPPGGAVVFSCSILHAVRPVTAGRRMVFLPFVYDGAHAALRRANQGFLGAAEPPAAAPEPVAAES
ncbi:2OG-Fe(II) oxygenase [Azospirillum sp.]|uniref:2OG-Fe(II) oxygenase n=1 Tax=Azospirillum sp. TaxID=34012 RepID=UPI002D5F11BB|nr:2OG-Fe(II) oxygenase [Azospirillum sp.]HYD69725.1 2OG-Fe(II) oxygenase [Azospirillum sp.]